MRLRWALFMLVLQIMTHIVRVVGNSESRAKSKETAAEDSLQNEAQGSDLHEQYTRQTDWSNMAGMALVAGLARQVSWREEAGENEEQDRSRTNNIEHPHRQTEGLQ